VSHKLNVLHFSSSGPEAYWFLDMRWPVAQVKRDLRKVLDDCEDLPDEAMMDWVIAGVLEPGSELVPGRIDLDRGTLQTLRGTWGRLHANE